MLFFGQRWDAPAFDEATEVPVPVGETCLMCEETVEQGDSGIITPYMDARGGTRSSPIHLECHLRSIVGSVAHLEGRCSCVTGRAADDRTGGTRREDARAVLAWLQQHRDDS